MFATKLLGGLIIVCALMISNDQPADGDSDPQSDQRIAANEAQPLNDTTSSVIITLPAAPVDAAYSARLQRRRVRRKLTDDDFAEMLAVKWRPKGPTEPLPIADPILQFIDEWPLPKNVLVFVIWLASLGFVISLSFMYVTIMELRWRHQRRALQEYLYGV